MTIFRLPQGRHGTRPVRASVCVEKCIRPRRLEHRSERRSVPALPRLPGLHLPRTGSPDIRMVALRPGEKSSKDNENCFLINHLHSFTFNLLGHPASAPRSPTTVRPIAVAKQPRTASAVTAFGSPPETHRPEHLRPLKPSPQSADTHRPSTQQPGHTARRLDGRGFPVTCDDRSLPVRSCSDEDPRQHAEPSPRRHQALLPPVRTR